jgi:hypothetical protein
VRRARGGAYDARVAPRLGELRAEHDEPRAAYLLRAAAAAGRRVL